MEEEMREEEVVSLNGKDADVAAAEADAEEAAEGEGAEEVAEADEDDDVDDDDDDDASETVEDRMKRLNDEYRVWLDQTTVLMYAFSHSTRLGEAGTSLADVDWLSANADEMTTRAAKESTIFAVENGDEVRGFTHTLAVAANVDEPADGASPAHVLLVESVVPRAFHAGFAGPDPRGLTARNADDAPLSKVVRRMPVDAHMTRVLANPHDRVSRLLGAFLETGDIQLLDVSRYEGDERTLTLKGHKKKGYGLEWNPFRREQLASACYSGKVLLWDVEGGSGASTAGFPKLHKKVVNLLSWSRGDPSVLATCSDDKSICLVDTRSAELVERATTGSAVITVEFNPHHKELLSYTNEEGDIMLKDTRMLSRDLFRIETRKQVTCTRWMSGGEDVEDASRLVAAMADGVTEVYDLKHLQEYPLLMRHSEGDCCLLGSHYGHKSSTEGVSCPPRSDLLADGCVASVETDGYLQVWRFNEQALDLSHGLYDPACVVPPPSFTT
eukprot:Rhum_TRINITY_DN4577_c0_g1::Rhum_TRINITY_DN4577_c0_g1_i1::g.14874::m.14874/K10752/RBBP4, HAT2, CAF1, MIS16; histone-binding protein RBBP4